MPSLIDVFGDLGAGIGAGLTNYTTARRQVALDAQKREEEELRRRRLEQELRLADEQERRAVADQERQVHEAGRREVAGQIDALRSTGAGQVEGGDYAGAARGAGRLQQLLGQYTGAPAGPGIVGGVRQTTREGARPAPGFVGPMPAETVREHVYDTPGTVKALRGLYGVKPPASRVVAFGRGGLAQVLAGAMGEPEVKVLREPDQTTGGLALTDNGDGTSTYVPKVAGATVVRPARKGRGGSGRAAKPRYGWVNDGKGGKVYVQLSAGMVNPANPRAGAAPKPLTYKQALDTAKGELGGGRFVTPGQQAQIVARARQLERESKGPDELDAWLASKRKGK